MRLFEQFQEVGTTVIIASHERDLIAFMNKPVVELSQGAVTFTAHTGNDEASRQTG
jgi:ABC-type ATPase involved in cell division